MSQDPKRTPKPLWVLTSHCLLNWLSNYTWLAYFSYCVIVLNCYLNVLRLTFHLFMPFLPNYIRNYLWLGTVFYICDPQIRGLVLLGRYMKSFKEHFQMFKFMCTLAWNYLLENLTFLKPQFFIKQMKTTMTTKPLTLLESSFVHCTHLPSTPTPLSLSVTLRLSLYLK